MTSEARRRAHGFVLLAAAVSAIAVPARSAAQPLTLRSRSIETDLQDHLGRARSQAVAAVSDLRQSPRIPSPAVDALLATLDLVAADTLLIHERQRDVARHLERNAAPGTAVARHASSIAALNRDLDDLLRAAESARSASAGGDRAALFGALERLVAGLERHQHEADRTPLSATLSHRSLRLPPLEPASAPSVVPAYQSRDTAAPQAADLASGGDAVIDAAIAAQARALNQNPIRIFEFVRNEIRTEFYYGAMKGAGETLRQKSGNDADQAALLLALMRASGVPGRYVRGVISLPAAQAQVWTGVSSARRVADVLTRAGIPFRAVRQGGAIGAFEAEHIWAEVFVPYSNYRGEPLDPAGRAWIPLDPSFKPTLHTAGIDLLAEMRFTADRLVSEYLSAPQTLTPPEFYRKQITDYLTANRPELSYDQVTGAFAIQTSSFGLLPSTLPYQTGAVRSEGAALPDELRHRVRFIAGPADAPAFDVTLAASEILGRRLTLSYVPATVEDQITASAFLGLDSTPAYLVQVRPVLKSAGVIRAAGETGIQMGAAHRFRIEIQTPRGAVTIENDLVAGGYYAIAFGSRDAAYQPPAARAPEDTERAAAELLFRQAADYLDAWNQTEAALERILRVVNVRPALAQVMVGNVYNRTLLFGQPQSLDWRGVFVDADLRISDPVPVGADDARARDFMRLSGLAGSMAEGDVLQRNLQADAVSAAKLLQLAAAEGIPIDTIDAANVDAGLAQLSTAEIVKREIRDGVNQGWQAIVPRRDFTRHAWTGIGYLLLDPATGAGGYFISGGLAGGMTSQSPQDWVEQQLAEELGRPYQDPPNADPSAAASIQKIAITDRQEGTAGQPAPRSIAVWVRDEDGLPVQGAQVTFRIRAGGGRFEASPEVTAVTDSLGVAEATPRLGASTSENPTFAKRLPSDQHVTQVGANVITASVTTPGGEVFIESEFTLLGYPGPADHIRKVLGDNTTAAAAVVGSSLLARLEDANDNPISNNSMLFEVLAPEPVVQGAQNLVVYPIDPPCRIRTPVLNDCNGSGTLLTTTSFQGAGVNTILGNTEGTIYRVRASALGTSVPPETFTIRSANPRSFGQGTYARPQLLMTRVELINDRGDPVDAAPPGTELNRPLEIVLFMIEDDYVLEPVDPPTGQPCTPDNPHCFKIRSLETVKVRFVDNAKPGFISFPFQIDAPVSKAAETTDVAFLPLRGEGSVGPVENTESGRHAVRVRTGPQPARNLIAVETAASVWVPCFDLYNGVVHPAKVTLEAGEAYGFHRECTEGMPPEPRVIGQEFVLMYEVFGVRPIMADAVARLTRTGVTAEDVNLNYQILPADYTPALAEVRLVEAQPNGTERPLGYFPAPEAAGSGAITLGRGASAHPDEPFDPANSYLTQLVLNHGAEVELRSDMAKLTVIPPPPESSDLAVGAVNLKTYLDSINQAVCPASGALILEIARDARVTIRIDGDVLTAGDVTYQDRPLAEGSYVVPVDAPVVPLPGEHSYQVVAVFSQPLAADVTITRSGTIRHDVIIEAFLPVGHTMIKGVDLQNGQFTLSREDLALGGHGPALEFSRSYSSAGNSASGPMGAGWRHNYDSRIVQNPCGTITVVGGEGSGIRFFSPAPGQDAQGNAIVTYRPQAGYHGSLAYRTQTDSYDYYTKTRTRHHYARAPGAQGDRPYRLAFTEDTHGNRLTLTYDAQPPHDLKVVTDAAGRTLTFTYQPFGIVAIMLEGLTVPENRIVKIEGPLDLLVTFEYDTYGNLTKAARGERVEKYDYTVANSRDRHNLVRVVVPNNETTGAGFDVTAITYYADADPFLGASHCGGNNLLLPDKCEFVKTFAEGAGTSSQALHQFTYDYSQVQTAIVTTVADPRDVRTRFTLHPQFGTVVEERVLIASGDNVKQMRWAFQDGINDVYVTRMTDPNGRVTTYRYDTNGNLTREAILVSTVPYAEVTSSSGAPVTEVVTSYEFDTTSNRLTKQTDAEGNVTTYELDPATGETLAVTTDPSDGGPPIVARYSYESSGAFRGLLRTITDPRRFVTTYTTYDQTGNPAGIVDPAGNTTTHVYDARGRPRQSTDTFGRHVTYDYDDLDRITLVTKKASHQPTDFEMASPDQSTATSYFPGGQIRTVTDGLGHVATYDYDALNRLVATRDETVDADGSAVTVAWRATLDGNGNKTGEVDRRGFTHQATYDPLNRLRTETVEGQLVASFSYDAAGNRLTETDVHGHTTTHQYNGLYQRVAELLPLEPFVRRKVYDLAGNVLRFTDANNRLTVRAFDGVYRLKSETDPAGVTTTYRYDASGNAIAVETNTGLSTRFEGHDGLNRPARMVRTFRDPIASETIAYETGYEYDDRQHARVIRNARGIRSRERYNGHDAVIEQSIDFAGLNLRLWMAYDANGNLAALKDSEGPVVDLRHVYDGLNRRIRTIYALGHEERFFFDGAGNLVRAVDRRGIVRRHEYDALGRKLREVLVESLTNAANELVWASFEYDDRDNVIRGRDANRNLTTIEHDALHREVRTVDALGQVRRSEWDGVNRIAEIDKRGIRTEFQYDALDRVVRRRRVEQGSETVSSAQFLDLQNRRIEIDARGLETITQLDPLQRVRRLSARHPTLAASYGTDEILLEEHAYDDNGNRTSTTDANGNVTTFQYDAADRLIARIDGAGSPGAAATLYTYDASDNLLTVKDGRAHAGRFDVRYTYDYRYRRVREENGAGEATLFTYDENDNLRILQEPAGGDYVTFYSYDELNRLLAVDESRGGAGGVTRYQYDANRNQIAQQDASGNLTTYGHDALNRLTELLQHSAPGALTATTHRTDPAGGDRQTARRWQVAYDANDNRVSLVDAEDQRVTMSYDYLDRLARKEYSSHRPGPDGSSVYPQPFATVYGYDENGNLRRVEETKQTSASTTVAEVCTMEYDLLGRLSIKTNYDGKTLRYSYDRAGNRTAVTDADGGRATYQFDSRNRIAAVESEFGAGVASTQYMYWPDGLRQAVRYPNGAVAEMAYDAADRLQALVNHDGNPAQPISRYDYRYDANGNRVSQVELHRRLDAETPGETTYSFDPLNRLAGVRYPSGEVRYSLAPNGNRLTEAGVHPRTLEPLNRQYVYNRLNQLTAVLDTAMPTASAVLAYDLNGNTVRQRVGVLEPSTGEIPAPVSEKTWSFNIRDQLTRIDELNGQTVSFDYDYNGRRVKTILPAAHVRYLYDGGNVLQEYDGASGLTNQKYNYGEGLLSVVRPQPSRHTLFYLVDGLGSTSELADESGGIQASYSYDVWGATRQSFSLTGNNRRFLGHYSDTDTGLQYFGARYYDETIGRFITQDSFLGRPNEPATLHRYQYANGNPTVFFDPDGHASVANCNDEISFRCTARDVSSFLRRGVGAIGRGLFNAGYETLAMVYDLEQIALSSARSVITPIFVPGYEPKPIEFTSSIGRAADEGMGTLDILNGMATNIVKAPVEAIVNTGKAMASGDPGLMGDAFGNLELMLGSFLSPKGRVRPGRSTIAELGEIAAHKNLRPGAPRPRSAASTIAQTEIERHLSEPGGMLEHLQTRERLTISRHAREIRETLAPGSPPRPRGPREGVIRPEVVAEARARIREALSDVPETFRAGERAAGERIARATTEAAEIRMLESMIEGINPTGSMMNCANCSLALDVVLGGGRAVAAPSKSAVYQNVLAARFGGAGPGRSALDAWLPIPADRPIHWMRQAMLAEGPGARGIVFSSRGPGQIGHFFNVVNVNGKVRFLDGQTGKLARFYTRTDSAPGTLPTPEYKSFSLLLVGK